MKTVPFFLALLDYDLYSFEVNKKSLVKTEFCRLSQKLKPKLGTNTRSKKLHRHILQIRTEFQKNRYMNKKVFPLQTIPLKIDFYKSSNGEKQTIFRVD